MTFSGLERFPSLLRGRDTYRYRLGENLYNNYYLHLSLSLGAKRAGSTVSPLVVAAGVDHPTYEPCPGGHAA